MHQIRSILLFAVATAAALLLSASIMAALASVDEVDPEAADEPARQSEEAENRADRPAEDAERVILRVNRNLTVMGHVQLEDDDVIVVRTQRGEVQSFSKIRVRQIIRLVDPQPDQHGVVVLRNGQTREGIILEDAFEHVLIEIEGIPAKLRREFVSHVVLEPTVDQRYEQARASLQPNMVDQHFALCRWLVEQRRYELARDNLLEILDQHDHYDAKQLLHVVEAQLALQAAAKSDEGAADGAEPAEPEAPERLPARLLTDEEVNLIRVYEVDFDDPPQMQIKPDAIRQFFQQYGTHEIVPATQSERNAMIRGDAADIVRLMFELRARELYPEIQVRTEPASLNLFRRRVHNTWLLNNCATSGCHGGPDAGDLYLHRTRHTDPRVRYTNFMILDRLEVDPEWPLINYNDPEMSLIVQYGLRREIARLPHPEVRGWTPVFARASDRMKEDTVRWIESMMQPRPIYPIDFDPMPREPGHEQSTQTGESVEAGDEIAPAAAP